MPAYQIGTFGFVRWEGQPPQLVRNHLAKFIKTGQSGLAAQLLGIHGNSFDVTLTAAFETQDQGLVCENGYRFLIGAGTQNILYNGVNYFTTFAHSYLIESVDTVSFSRHPLLIGPGYVYYGGWLLKSRWVMTPIVAG